MGTEKEIVVIVDEKNQVIGSVTRQEMRQMELIHRAAYILVFNGKEELFVHKRTSTKDIYPSHHDIAAGGVVLAGESYEESARRELSEELGVREVELKKHFDFFYEDCGNRVWGRVFSCVYDGRLTLQKEEVESGSFMSLAAALKLSEHEPLTPDGIYLLKRFSGQ